MKDKGKRHTLFRIQKVLLTFRNYLIVLKDPASWKTLYVVSNFTPPCLPNNDCNEESNHTEFYILCRTSLIIPWLNKYINETLTFNFTSMQTVDRKLYYSDWKLSE